MPTKSSPAKRAKKSDPAVSYDDFKEHEGKKYTGMKIGRSHKWYYDRGATPKTQRKRMIQFLRDVIADLEQSQTDDAEPNVKAEARPLAKPRKVATPPSMMKRPGRRRERATAAPLGRSARQRRRAGES